MEENHSKPATYRIGAIANLTGLSTHTIRAWERRYGMVLSDRSEGGTRLYDADSLDRLRLIKKLLDHGESISMICNLNTNELRERLDQFPSQAFEKFAQPTQQTDEAQSLNIVAVGKNPFDKSEFTLRPNLKVVIEHQFENQSQLEEWLHKSDNLGELNGVVLFEDLLSSQKSKALSPLLKRFKRLQWIIVFNMGSGRELTQLHEAGIKAVKGPLPQELLLDSIVLHLQPSLSVVTVVASDPSPAPPPLFSVDQLNRLGNLSSSIQCECPSHMSTLIHNLIAFEKYCETCENESPEDAALHAELGRETAKSRAILEQMLVKVCAHDNIDIN